MSSALDPAPKQLVIRAHTLELDHGYLAEVQLLCDSVERLSIVLQELPGGNFPEAFYPGNVVWNLLRPYTVLE